MRAPVLTDHAVSWFAYSNENTGSLIASLLTRIVFSEQGKDDLHGTGARLRRVLTHPDQIWPFDYAGVVRVGRLLAAEQGDCEVVAQTMCSASLLLMARPAWEQLHQEFGETSAEWDALQSAYCSVRARVMHYDVLAHDRLLSVGLFARDALLPVPSTYRIADVRFPGFGLGFAWPGERTPPTAGPLESSPLLLDERAVLTHVLLPKLRTLHVDIPWREPDVSPRELRDVVGTTPSDGSWSEVLLRVIQHLGFGRDIEAAGYAVADVVTYACTGRTLAPAAGGKAPAAGVGAPAARAIAPPSPTDPAAANEVVGNALPAGSAGGAIRLPRTYQQILAFLREQGIHGHDRALREIALLADDECPRTVHRVCCSLALLGAARPRSWRRCLALPTARSCRSMRPPSSSTAGAGARSPTSGA
ncbi:MAG: hypothetical protein ABIW79_04170 [Gemmatimonas sp.]